MAQDSSDNPRPHMWDKWDAMKLEDAISELDYLKTNPGYVLLMEALKEERASLSAQVAYIMDNDELRMHQGYMQAMDRMVQVRQDLIKVLNTQLRAQNTVANEEVEKRPLGYNGL